MSNNLKLAVELLHNLLALPDGAKIVGLTMESHGNLINLEIVGLDWPEGFELGGKVYAVDHEGAIFYHTVLIPPTPLEAQL